MSPDSPPSRTDVLGLTAPELRDELAPFLAARREPEFRVDQVANWAFEQLAVSFEEMTTLPKELRAELAAAFSLTPLEPARVARSEDGTVKHLWALEDGEQVESVLIPAGDRVTLCLSSQVGCALGCRFCATGHFGFRRQLRPAEIVAQYRDSLLFARQELGAPISNVVFMGMGEPMANREAVLQALEVLHGPFGVGARRITVSTVGLVPGIRALAVTGRPYRLAVSLHAPNHELRERLVPAERRHPLPELMEALEEYRSTAGRRITFEYTLIEGVNDAPELAEELAGLAAPLGAFVNLIPFNPIPDVDWEPSSRERTIEFAKRLHGAGVSAAVRTPRGRDIAAACGQLRLERGAA